MKQRKKIVFYIIMIIFILLLFECSSFIIYSASNKKVFSFSQLQSKRLNIASSAMRINDQAQQNTVNLDDGAEVVHPYLGYVVDPTNQNRISEYGFPGKTLPISSKSENQIVIGLFGGSFAEQTALQKSNTLIRLLEQSSIYQDKNIIVHTLALGGYKQPQQLLTLTYLLSLGAHFDIIINIDGFNEVTLPPTENIPKNVFPFYPRLWYARTNVFNDPKLLKMIGEISLLFEKQRNWADIFSAAPLRFSVTCNLFWELSNKMLARKRMNKLVSFYKAQAGDTQKTNYLTQGPSFQYSDDSSLYRALAEVWMTSSLQMHRLCMANNMAYFHFLQPNQYVAGSKIMKNEELKIAFQEQHAYKESVEKGYPFLMHMGKRLVEQGVNFSDLTMIFEQNDRLLYKDDCCHLNAEGYEIIASTMGEIIIAKMKSSRMINIKAAREAKKVW